MRGSVPFTVVYQDDSIIAVNKASSLSVTPDRFDRQKKSLLDLLATYTRKKLFVVHRIDAETSGLVVFAKNARAHKNLSCAFEERTIKKLYIAVVHGRPEWDTRDCDLRLLPNGNKRHQTIVDRYHGKKSLSHFENVFSTGQYSVVRALPETGRTHQLRVHLAALGHGIVCDQLYGSTKPVFLSDFKRSYRGDRNEEAPLLQRLGLHAASILLPANVLRTEGDLLLEAPLQRDIAAAIKQMAKFTSCDTEGLTKLGR
jgi:23S rRNA pseudouridine1911/1915/1917 synthase